MIIPLITIYIISVIGAILSIRYDKCFDEDDFIIFAIFCPVLNSVITIIELLEYIPNPNKILYKLITYKRK